MYQDRLKFYEELEAKLDTKLISYVTSDRQGFETQIAGDVIDIFIDQLDKIGVVEKISLFLYTRGGDTAAAWNIINLLRQFCDFLQVIIPHKAHSAGTLISIGANEIVMTKQATLGPIDPSINTALNPAIPGAPPNVTFPVSVEAVKGYLQFAKDELMIKDDNALASIMIKLSDSVHPLVLGEVYRSRAQIKMLAEKLLTNQISDADKAQKIISFLCSDSGSHDYTINRREARNNLGLNIKIPTPEEYNIIKEIYNSFALDLGLGIPFDPKTLPNPQDGSYSIKRGFIESRYGGCSYFVSRGAITQVAIPSPVPGIPPAQNFQDNRIFEGWEHEVPEQ